jgi:hypothetical protein
MVMKWDKPHEEKGKHFKFQQMWLGPFLVKENISLGMYRMKNLKGEIDLLPVNGQFLRILMNL